MEGKQHKPRDSVGEEAYARLNLQGFEVYVEPEDLDEALQKPTDMRLFVIAYAMYNKGYSVEKLHELTKIDRVCVHS